MKRRTMVIVAMLLVAMAAAPLLLAHQRTKKQAMAEDPIMILAKLRELRAELDLTPEQVQSLKEIGKSVREANAPDRQSLRANVAQAGLLLLDDPSNIAGAEALLDRNDMVRNQLRANVLKGVAEAIEVLTPEQRQILEDRLTEHVGGR